MGVQQKGKAPWLGPPQRSTSGVGSTRRRYWRLTLGTQLLAVWASGEMVGVGGSQMGEREPQRKPQRKPSRWEGALLLPHHLQFVDALWSCADRRNRTGDLLQPAHASRARDSERRISISGGGPRNLSGRVQCRNHTASSPGHPALGQHALIGPLLYVRYARRSRRGGYGSHCILFFEGELAAREPSVTAQRTRTVHVRYSRIELRERACSA